MDRNSKNGSSISVFDIFIGVVIGALITASAVGYRMSSLSQKEEKKEVKEIKQPSKFTPGIYCLYGSKYAPVLASTSSKGEIQFHLLPSAEFIPGWDNYEKVIQSCPGE